MRNLNQIHQHNKFLNLGFAGILIILFAGCASAPKTPEDDFDLLLLKKKLSLENYNPKNKSEKADEYFINGSNKQGQGLYAEAIINFQNALKYDTSATIYLSMAKCYKELEMLDFATKYALAAYELRNDFIPVLELMTEIELMQFNVDNSITILKKIIELDSSKARRFALASVYEYSDKEKALELYEGIYDETGDLRVLEKMVKLYRETGKTKKLLKNAEKLFRHAPNDFSAAASMIELFLNQSMYDELFSYLDEIDENFTATELADIYTRIGSEIFLTDSEKLDENIPRLLNKIDNRFYFEPELNVMMGYLAGRANDSARVEKYFRRSLKASEKVNIPLQVSYYYSNKENFVKALDVLLSQRDKYPGNQALRENIGYMYVFLDSTRRALDVFLELSREYSTKVEYISQTGALYDELDLHDSSDIFYEKALKLSPGDPLTNNNYAYSLSERGVDLNRALEMSNMAVAAEPANAAFLDTKAWILFKLGNNEKALEYIKKSVETGGASAEVFEHMGDIYKEMDKMQDAVEAWEKSIELEPKRNSVEIKLKKFK